MPRKTYIAYLGLGANLGERHANLEQALVLLQGPGLRITRVSSVYESEPIGSAHDQPAFYNAVVEVETQLEPLLLLQRCLDVEKRMGRERTVPKGPRVIDIDVLLVGDLVLSTPELTVPHPELTKRAFVVLPLLELAPMITDPRDGQLLCRYTGDLLRSQHIIKQGSLKGFLDPDHPTTRLRKLSPLPP